MYEGSVFQTNPALQLIVTENGGHLGFDPGQRRGSGWIRLRWTGFLDAQEKALAAPVGENRGSA